MSEAMTVAEWRAKYKPGKRLNAQDHHETVRVFAAQHPNRVWTELSGDEGTYIVSGWHYVNRIAYYLCEFAFNEGEFVEIEL